MLIDSIIQEHWVYPTTTIEIETEQGGFEAIQLDVKPSFINSQILSRIAYAALAIFDLLIKVTLIPVGLILGSISILSGGKYLTNYAKEALSLTKSLISSPFFHLLKTVNPKAKIKKTQLLTQLVKKQLIQTATDFEKSNNFLSAQIASRLTYGAMAISVLATRTIDGLVGVTAAVASFATFGIFENVNGLAQQGLKFPGVISDLYKCTLKIINPKVNTSSWTLIPTPE
jgi:hypothetical protein